MQSSHHLDLKQLANSRETIREKAPLLKPSDDFYFKSLRGDENNFFYRFIEELIDPTKRYKKRLGAKKNFTVRGDGIYARHDKFVDKYPLKPTQYTPEEKAKYTKFQSTSLGLLGLFSAIFGLNKRASLLAGMMFNQNHVLLTNRSYSGDAGTISRRYDHDEEKDAEQYFYDKAGKTLFAANQFEAFKAVIEAKNHRGKHNEVLARLSLNCDDSIPMNDRDKIFIGNDNLESRLLAKQYRDTLLLQLIQAGKCNPDYKFPIVFYTDNEKLLFKEYTDEEYQLDFELAHSIYTNIEYKNKKYKNHKYEFLFALSPDEIQSELSQSFNDMSFAMDVMQHGYVHIVKFLCEKSGFDLRASFMKSLAAATDKAKFASSILYQVIRCEDSAFAHAILSWINDPELIAQMSYTLPNLLSTALKKDMIPFVKELLKCGFDINVTNKAGETLLHLLAKKGDIELVNALLEDEHIQVNLVNNNGETALYLAVNHQHTAVAKALLKRKKIEIHHTFSNSLSLFSLAAEKGQLEIVETLLKHPDIQINQVVGNSGIWCENGDQTAVMIALSKGHIDIVKALLADERTQVHQSSRGDKTLLYMAAATGNLEIVNILLKYKEIDINKAYKAYCVPLWVAVENGYLDVVKALLADERTEVNSPVDYRGRTPLHLAVDRRKLEIVRALLGRDDIAINQSAGTQTPLGSAVGKEYFEIVKVLVADERINVDHAFSAAAKCGLTEVINALLIDERLDVNRALYVAASAGLTEAVNALLKLEVNVNQADEDGDTPLHIAAYNGKLEVVKALLSDIRIKVNPVNARNETPLYRAVSEERVEIVKVLLADPRTELNIANKSQHFTPLHLAIKDKHNVEIVKALIADERTLVNVVDCYRNTTLHNAVYKEDIDIIKALLEHEKIEVSLTNKQGMTAYDVAVKYNKSEIQAVFEEKLSTRQKFNGNVTR